MVQFRVLEGHDSGGISRRTLKRDWRLSQSAFDGLLAWLHHGESSPGDAYLEIRRRLADYFDRKNCPSPEDLADEVLNRVARRLEESGGIVTTAPARYCYTVAKFVYLEAHKERKRNPVSSDSRIFESLQSPQPDEMQLQQGRFVCLEKCAALLCGRDHELIFEYYQCNQNSRTANRHLLAQRLQLTANALTIRACRIRSKLETCMRQCLQGSKFDSGTV